MDSNRAYLLWHIDWNWQVGRLGYCRKLNQVRLLFVVRGDLKTVWYPLGFGFFWRQKSELRRLIRKEDL